MVDQSSHMSQWHGHVIVIAAVTSHGEQNVRLQARVWGFVFHGGEIGLVKPSQTLSLTMVDPGTALRDPRLSYVQYIQQRTARE